MKSSIREAQKSITKERIYDSFLDLLLEKDIYRITVKETCERAGINRGTFYLHFRDVVDLSEQINSWYISKSLPYHQKLTECFRTSVNREQIYALVKGNLQVLASWPKYAEIMFGRNRCPEIIDHMMNVCKNMMIAELKDSPHRFNQSEYEYRFAYIAYGAEAIIRKWCQGGLTTPIDTVTDYIVKNILQSLPAENVY